MRESLFVELFGLDDKVAVVTGGSGTLGREMAGALARAGARVAVLARSPGPLEAVTARIESQGGEAVALAADVLDRSSLERAREDLLAKFGRVDVLVNAAGGNVPGATLDPGGNIFDLPASAFDKVVDLNLLGTLQPTQVFGAAIASSVRDEGGGSIVNISSMAASTAISRVVGYSAAKAAVENLTRWLSVELARRYGDALRVNAIAPGFFLADQNRDLLVGPEGDLTERGRSIVARTPAGRFGRPEELAGTLVWLCGPGARFVTGIVVPVDGGFSGFSGI